MHACIHTCKLPSLFGGKSTPYGALARQADLKDKGFVSLYC